MYAIVEIAGKQFKVRENEKVYVPRQDAQIQDTVSFDRVLLISGETNIQVGTPTVEGASVAATVIAHGQADKVLVFKKKRRKRFRVKRGHRQPFTQLLINGVDLNGASGSTAKKAKKAKPAVEKEAPVAVPAVEAAPKAAKPAPAVEKAAKAAKPAPAVEKAAKAAKPAPAVEKAAKAAKPAPAVEKAAKAAKPAPAVEKAAKAAKPAPAKKAADGKDDLRKIEGIGPKIASIFAENGIPTFAALAGADVDRLREILAAAGSRYRSANPETWPEQAALAAAGDWDALAKLQDELDGGRRPE